MDHTPGEYHDGHCYMYHDNQILVKDKSSDGEPVSLNSSDISVLFLFLILMLDQKQKAKQLVYPILAYV